ncbi:MAG: MMPL family transporter [Thermomicrobiales bacterium]|nr:MMPL family transporter [Thermomicrobiales bacterium]
MAVPSTRGVARWSARRPWLVVGFWLLLVVMAGAASGMLPSPISNDDGFTTEPESLKGDRLIEQRLNGQQPQTETVVITSDHLTIDDPAFRQVIESTSAALRGLDGTVASVTNVLDLEAAGDPTASQLISDDRMTAVLPVVMAGDSDALEGRGEEYVRTIEAQRTADVTVLSVGDLSGDVAYGAIAERDLARAELFGLPIALIVLVVVFGALLAAGVPLVVALASIAVATGMATVLGQWHPVSDITFNLIVMIGLAVGIDYALFIVERYREERRHGHERRAAIENAGGTATKAVVCSGLTVVIALMGMFIIPVTVFRGLAVGAALVVLVSIVSSMTLIPALLALLGDRIDWPRKRHYDDPLRIALQRKRDSETIHAGFWGRLTQTVMTHRVVSVILAAGLLLALALPYLDLQTGVVGLDTLPESDVKRGYEILSEKFYAGVIAPVEIVVDGNANDPAIQNSVDRLIASLGQNEMFGPATTETNAAGDLIVVSVPLAIDGNLPAGEQIIEELRNQTIPTVFAETEASVYVTGEAAFNHDFNVLLAEYTPYVFAFVLGLSFLVLLLAFRSIIVPIKAILMNLLSVGAAYGVMVLVFQKGIGNELLGFGQSPVIEAWIPVFLFCILFGLSMDYHVFLLSRIREHYDRTGNNSESVAVGLQSTARIITGAALIMVAVFGAFAAGSLIEMQQMGFGLAVAIFLDATIVRSVLVPSSMALLGNANWYLPRWLRWLPDLRIEGHPVGPVPTVDAPTPARAPRRAA